MQDRFKFRCFNKFQNKMFDVKLISYIDGIVKRIEVQDGERILIFDEWQNNIDNTVLMQCTGLKDKNGTLIYEGDVVQFYDDEFLQKMKIIWDNDELDFKAIGLKKSVECYEEDFSYLGYIKKEDSLEVIGNIYENPELIGGVK